MSAGGAHSLAITADGAVWSWGVGTWGRLGHGDEQRQLLPKKVEALAGQRVVTVSAGSEHSFALTADGAAWSWGYGDYGRLGHGVEQNQLLPKKIEALAGQRVVAVSAGTFHSLARTADGAVWSWGAGGHGGFAGCLGHVRAVEPCLSTACSADQPPVAWRARAASRSPDAHALSPPASVS